MFYPKKKKKLRREDLDRVMQDIREKKRQEDVPAPAPAVSSTHQEIHIHNHPSAGGTDNPADADLKRLLERSKWLP